MTHPSRHGNNDHAPADNEAEAAATTTAIAGLRRRLSRQGIPEHPKVRRELRKLAEQIALVEQAGHNPGRHRVRPGLAPAGQDDCETTAPGLKPDPATARNSAEYVTVLWQYRAWSGDPSWRQIAARAKQKRVHSTIYAAMRRSDLPKLEVVNAIITGCGGDTADLHAFTTAWQRLSTASRASQPGQPGMLPAPVHALQFAPTT
jgi:hypothetical protein